MSIGTVYVQASKLIDSVSAYSGVSIDQDTTYDYSSYHNWQTPEFFAKFPHGKIPAFESKDGFRLFEGIVIAKYIASKAPKSGLLGSSADEEALVDAWVHLAETEFWFPVNDIKNMCTNKMPYSKPVRLSSHQSPYANHLRKQIHTYLLSRQQRTLTTLNTHLTKNTFLVGERITFADLVLAHFVRRAVMISFDAPLRAQFPAVIRHLETIVNHPKLKALFGEIKYIENGLQFVPPAKEKKEKEAAPAPAAAKDPKEKKPKVKDADEDEDEPLVPAEPKVKNPLDDLSKSSFNLEDWKRAYSNKETRGKDGALEWLYEHFDKDGFSLWRVDFKYNEELTQTFMSSNQIGGFFNRLEASRKYLFGSVGVLGKANDSIISGALIARGQDIEPVVNVAPDWESYAFKKIDLGNAEDKEFFEAALAWDLKIDGKEWVDGKNFK
ncbi:hypothetical protein D9757_012201 [Collybiopsis confluens]|uniref:Elongation factor 1-gamma n=1 Tax=Collybiopsis confluens TaxID=2823264 RepID=A0A8H5CWW4_9AGAR|nr:hypothetical protein D9757_012201 [Collybiopsis confluens]